MNINNIQVINKKKLWLVPIIFIIGLTVYVQDFPLTWLASWIFGIAGLLVSFGWKQTQSLFKPMQKSYLKKLIGLYIGMIVTTMMVVLVANVLFHALPTDHEIIKDSGSQLNFGNLDALIFYFETLVGASGEEVMMASITLPAVALFRKNRYGLIVIMIMSVLLFGAIHLPVYNFNFVSCVVVATGRVFFNLAWFKTNSLRGGIYLHLLDDGIALGSVMLQNTF